MENTEFEDVLNVINDLYDDFGKILGSVNTNYNRATRLSEIFSIELLDKVAENIDNVSTLKKFVQMSKKVNWVIRLVLIVVTTIIWFLF